MLTFIHLALASDGTVMAHFSLASHASKFCFDNDCTHVPYNLNNRDREPAPLVGAVYKA